MKITVNFKPQWVQYTSARRPKNTYSALNSSNYFPIKSKWNIFFKFYVLYECHITSTSKFTFAVHFFTHVDKRGRGAINYFFFFLFFPHLS